MTDDVITSKAGGYFPEVLMLAGQLLLLLTLLTYFVVHVKERAIDNAITLVAESGTLSILSPDKGNNYKDIQFTEFQKAEINTAIEFFSGNLTTSVLVNFWQIPSSLILRVHERGEALISSMSLAKNWLKDMESSNYDNANIEIDQQLIYQELNSLVKYLIIKNISPNQIVAMQRQSLLLSKLVNVMFYIEKNGSNRELSARIVSLIAEFQSVLEGFKLGNKSVLISRIKEPGAFERLIKIEGLFDSFKKRALNLIKDDSIYSETSELLQAVNTSAETLNKASARLLSRAKKVIPELSSLTTSNILLVIVVEVFFLTFLSCFLFIRKVRTRLSKEEILPFSIDLSGPHDEIFNPGDKVAQSSSDEPEILFERLEELFFEHLDSIDSIIEAQEKDSSLLEKKLESLCGFLSFLDREDDIRAVRDIFNLVKVSNESQQGSLSATLILEIRDIQSTLRLVNVKDDLSNQSLSG